MPGDTKSGADLARGGIGRGRSRGRRSTAPRPQRSAAPPYQPPGRGSGDYNKGRGVAQATRFKQTAPYRRTFRAAVQGSPPSQRALTTRRARATPARQRTVEQRVSVRRKQRLQRRRRAEIARGKSYRNRQVRRRERLRLMPVLERLKAVPYTARGETRAYKSPLRNVAEDIPFYRSFSGKDKKAFQSILTGSTVTQPKVEPSLGKVGASRRGNLITGEISTTKAGAAARERALTIPFSSLKGTTVTGGFPGSAKAERRLQSQQSGMDAPALAILDAVTRPLYAQAGATKAIVEGKGQKAAGKEFVKGFTGKQKTLYSDVLKSAGVKNKAVAGTAGFLLDVFADPTTYATGGRTSAARVGAKKAIRAAEKDFAKAGYKLSPEERTTLRRVETENAARTLPTNKGVGLGATFFGKTTPLVGAKTTAKISRKIGVSKTATKARESKLSQTLFRDLAPDVKPTGVSQADWEASRAAGRTRTAQTHSEKRRARRVELAIRKAVPKREDQRLVIDAIEAGTIDRLPEELRGVANVVSGEFERVAAREQEVKKLGTTRENYIYHLADPKAAKKLDQTVGRLVDNPEDKGAVVAAIKAGAVDELPKELQKIAKQAERDWTKRGRAAPRRGGISQNVSAQQRKYEGTLAEMRQAMPGLFEEDLAKIVRTRLDRSASVVADENYRVAIQKIGRPAKPGEVARLGPDDALYRVTRDEGIRKVYPDPRASGSEIEKRIAETPKEYMVLPERVGDRVSELLAPENRTGLGKWFDKVQGTTKFLLTQPNPGYHARNLYGDLINAYRGGLDPADVVTAYGGIRRLNARERAEMQIGRGVDASLQAGGVKIGDELIPWDEFLDEALEHNVVRSGFSAADLVEARPVRGKGAAGEKFNRWSQNREDLARLALYITSRKKGLTAAQASDVNARFLYDYTDLTPFERKVMRRIIPFWTFTSRNTRSMVGTLFTRPGKLANIEKARGELQRVSGLPEGYEGSLQDYEARGLPFPNPGIPGLGKLIYPALPLTDLNRLSLNPAEQLRQTLASADFLTKLAVEVSLPQGGYSLFFGEKIEDPKRPWRPAPDGLADALDSLPGGDVLKKRLGLTQYIDKRTGKPIWGWPARIDYVAKALPELNTAFSLLTEAKNDRGVNRFQRFAAWTTGLKSGDFDPTTIQINLGQDKLTKLQAKRDRMNLQPGPGDKRRGGKYKGTKLRFKDGRYTPEGYKIANEIKALQKRVDALKTKRGDPGAGKQSVPTGPRAAPWAVPYVPKKRGAKKPGALIMPGGRGGGKKKPGALIMPSSAGAVIDPGTGTGDWRFLRERVERGKKKPREDEPGWNARTMGNRRRGGDDPNNVSGSGAMLLTPRPVSRPVGPQGRFATAAALEKGDKVFAPVSKRELAALRRFGDFDRRKRTPQYHDQSTWQRLAKFLAEKRKDERSRPRPKKKKSDIELGA